MSLPATVIKTLLTDGVRWLVRVVRKARQMPRPKAVAGQSHKTTDHIEAQIRSATTGINRLPPRGR